MASIDDLKWEIEDLGRQIEMAVKQLEPTKQLMWQIEDNVRQTAESLKEAQRILGKAKDLADSLARQTP